MNNKRYDKRNLGSIESKLLFKRAVSQSYSLKNMTTNIEYFRALIRGVVPYIDALLLKTELSLDSHAEIMNLRFRLISSVGLVIENNNELQDLDYEVLRELIGPNLKAIYGRTLRVLRILQLNEDLDLEPIVRGLRDTLNDWFTTEIFQEFRPLTPQ